MPLVVPGITANNLGSSSQAQNSQTQDWLVKLMGKTLTDGASSETAFSKKDLPKDTRVISPKASVFTTDYKADRLNVHLAEDGTVAKVVFG